MMQAGDPATRAPMPPSAGEERQRARPTLRIGMSGLFLRYPHTGTGRYARRVLEQLAQAPDVRTLVVTDAPATSIGARSATVGLVRAPQPPLRLGAYAQKLYWEQLGLRLVMRRLPVDVLYSPHFSLPLFPGRRAVVSVHDVIPLTEPGYNESIATRLYFTLVGAAARQASAINTLSEYSAREIERVLDIPRSRIHVIPPGVEPHFNARPDAAAMARARARLALPERYLLYLGGGDARKNIGVLLEALAHLRRQADTARDGGPQLPLLVIAAATPKPAPSAHHPDWRGMARRLGVADGVHFVERVEEEDLPAVYRGALALLFPSRAEGFGLTPLEAMACGTPVLCSNATSLPEAVGEAGLLLAPDAAPAWAAAIRRLCGDGDLRGRLREAGMRQARAFRWEDTGSRVLAVLREVAQCES
ncbi:MAG TPA: glycosyltransferase family 1 protein [Chloroflexota bacterium]|nr:glycosyltransferase family 1 protein [Chloroflexota bacterium]